MTVSPAPADPFAPLLDALAARLAPMVAELVAARLAAPAPDDASTANALVDKRAVARALAVSQPTIDRMVREGMPFQRVNARKRFDVEACRAWAAARGRKPTTAPRRAPSDDVDEDEIADIARSAGLRHT